MTKDRPALRDRLPEDTAICTRCREVRDLMELDRLLWCQRCRFQARERAAWWGWAQGLAFGGLVAAYVFMAVRPTDLVMGGWIATIVAAVWIGARIGREIAYGVMRFTHGRTDDDPAASPGDPGGD